MKLFHVVRPYEEWFLNVDKFLAIQTRGQAGKPAGWCDGVAASVLFESGCWVPLDDEQWAQFRKRLDG